MSKLPFIKCACGAVAWNLGGGLYRCPACKIAPNSSTLPASEIIPNSSTLSVLSVRAKTKRNRKKAYRARCRLRRQEEEFQDQMLPGPYPAIHWS
jgi:hypothetical protein